MAVDAARTALRLGAAGCTSYTAEPVRRCRPMRKRLKRPWRKASKSNISPHPYASMVQGENAPVSNVLKRSWANRTHPVADDRYQWKAPSLSLSVMRLSRPLASSVDISGGKDETGLERSRKSTFVVNPHDHADALSQRCLLQVMRLQDRQRLLKPFLQAIRQWRRSIVI